MAKKSKYGNKKCIFNGIKFDSISEKDRYVFLLDQQKQGKISDLQCQMKYPLHVHFTLICTYIADFDYLKDNKVVTEDVKGMVTAIFRLKAKLFKVCFLRDIQIIDKDNITNLVPVKKKRKTKK